MKHHTTFHLEGQFAGFEAGSKSPFKYLRLETPTGEHRIKLSKSLRLMLFRYLAEGDSLRVVGYQKIDKHTGETKLKALDVVRVGQGSQPAVPPQGIGSAASVESVRSRAAQDIPLPASRKQKPARILVCNKSSCRKRGSEAVCAAIAQSLSQLDRTDVSIKKTGCMDRCKAGPNVVIMPDKAKYTRVSPNQITKLVQQHYGQPAAIDT